MGFGAWLATFLGVSTAVSLVGATAASALLGPRPAAIEPRPAAAAAVSAGASSVPSAPPSLSSSPGSSVFVPPVVHAEVVSRLEPTPPAASDSGHGSPEAPRATTVYLYLRPVIDQ